MAFEATDRVKKKGGAGTFEATSNMRFDESYAARRKNETSRALSEFYKRYDSDMADNAKFFSGEGSRLDRLQASGYKYSSQQYKDEAAKLLSGLERDRGFMSAEEYLAHAQILNGIINQDTAEYDKQINDLWGTKLSMGGNDAYKKALEQYAKEEKLKKKYTIEDGTGAIDILAKAEEARSKAAGSAAGEKPWLREYSDDAERLESIAASRITMDDYKKLSEMYGVKAKESKDGFDNNIKNESKMLQEILEYYKRPHSNGLEADDEEKNMREKLAYFSNKYGTDFADKIRRGETPVIDNIKFFSENDEYNKYKNEAAKYKAAAYFNDITSQIEAELEEKKNAGEDISRLFEIYNPDSVKIPSTTTDLFTRVSNFLLKGNVDEISGTVIPTEDSFSVNYDKATEYMTDDEKAIFNYLINTRGVEAATEYREMLNSEESYFSGIGTRKGYDIYNKYLKDKPVLGELYSVYAGAAGYFNNASNIPAMIKGEEIAPTQNTEQAALGYATSDMGKFGKVAADIGVNFGNMLPSILLSRLGGAASGSAAVASGVNAASVGVTAAAQAYEEAMKEGYDPRSAQGYAMLTGSSEALLEKALGGISGAIGTVTGASVEKLLSKVDNVLARMLIEGGVDMAGEFTEEYLQEVLDPVFRNICFDENNEIKPFSEEALYSGFIGAISAGLMNMGAGAAGIAGAASDVKYGGKINGTKVGDIAVELGQRMSAERAQAGGLYDGEGIRSEFRAVNPNVTATDRQTGNADAVAAGRLAGKILQNTNTSDTSEKKGNMFSRFTQKIKNVQTNYNMARLLNLVGENYSSEIRNAAKKSLIADGMTANNAEGISGIIAESIMSGEPASMALMFARAYNEDADTLTAVSNAYDGIMKDSVLSKVAEMGRGISTGNYNLVEDTKTEQGEAEVGSENNSYAEKPDISDNQTVRVKSIDDITGIDLSAGTVEIHGESVSLDRVDFRDSEVEYLVRTATSDMSSDEAAEMLSAYKKSDIEPGQFGSDWKYYRALGKAANIMPDSEYYKDPGGIFKISAEDKANAYRQGARIRLNAKKQENIEKKNMERAERIGKNYGKVDDKALSSVPRERRKAMRQVADVLSKFGYNIKFFKGSTEIGGMRRSANGIWKADTNTIYLRADAKYNATDIRGILGQTLAHEITHSIQDWSPAKYDELKTYIIEALTRSGDKLSVLVDKKQAAAESRGEKLDVDEAMDEVIADGCEMMLRDSKTLEKMARENRTLFEKVRDKLAEFIEKLRGALKGIYAGTDELHSASAELREVISDFTDMQKLFDEAFEDALGNMKESLTKSDKASENKKSTDGAVLKYSVEYTTDNRPVVIVDDDILKGVPRSQWIKTVKDTISSKFSGGIPIKGRLIRINSVSKNELLYSKYTQYLKSVDTAAYADKLRSVNNLDEIIIASTNYINEDLKHKRKDAFVDFARGDVLLKVGNKEYSAELIVGLTSSNNMVLYDVIGFNSTHFTIKKRPHHAAMQRMQEATEAGATSNNSISKNGENVNSEIKESTEDIVSDEDEAHKVRAELSSIKTQIKEIAFTKGSDRSLLPELEKKKSILERKILREEREQLAEDMLAVAETETERNFAERYRNTISETSEYEDKLADVKEKIQKAMFGGGDRSKLTALQNQKKQYEARISYRERLLTEYRGYKTFERLSKLREGIAARNAQERIKKRFEKKEARKQRSLMLNDVGKNINRMYAMLKKDTKTKHVASSMKPIVTAFLKSVSTNKVDYDRLIANNRAEIARLEKKRLSLTGEEQQTVTNEIERMKNSIDVYESYIRINKATADALASVLKAYDSAEDTQHLFDKDLYDRVREFAERMDGRTLYELSDSEVAELRDMTRMVSRYITRSNRVFTDERKQTVTQFSKRVIDQTENTQKKYSKLGKKVHDFTEKQRYSIMKPWELFEATGSEEMVRLYRNLQKGEGTWKDLIFKYSDYWKTNAEEKGITRKDLDEKHSILLAGGTEVALRTDDIMAIYAMSKREQARGHLLSETGGYRLPGHVVEVAKKSKGKGTKAKYEYVEGAEPVKLTENDLSNICAKLTDSQREFADLIQKYMSTELAEDGNVVSRALYDVDSFKEKFYFPIYTDKTYGKMCVLRAEGNVRLKSKSFTKETVEKAAGPLILRGFSEVWAEHANEMALYSSFVLPLEDIQKVLDYREPGFSMRQHLGEKLCAEIDDFLNAVNGGIKNTDTGRFAKFFSKYKAARVADITDLYIRRRMTTAMTTDAMKYAICLQI